ncbi:MAG: hypothetical protein A3E87_08810 [Gammaproteobacteria bacterium RIFCSPHIGHO2_12_FULL_35_23]|nr:MAG: hypothetical protein A3E87_08810 [Gammaproteobacteria bacterium RIFCSPHIGHO2_12_FULL_35_23]
MTEELIVYEQPVSELVRVCLRLEYLFKQLDNSLQLEASTSYTRNLVRILIEIVIILDRPDLKSKLTQEFHRLIKVISSLQAIVSVNKETVASTLAELNKLLNYFVNTKGKIAQALRDNEFIASIRLPLTTPGGDCSFDAPAFYYWQEQSINIRLANINAWLKHLDEIRLAVDLFLKIIRESAEPRKIVAENGYYHDILNTQPASQLICIGLAKKIEVYPEASVGKHRMNIRFLHPSIDQRPTQTEKSVDFLLTVCNI